MADVKPLPALPVTSLSVEAHAHRGRLIKHFLNDIHDPEIDSNRDGWLYVLEEALDSLTAECNRREWLRLLKRKYEVSKIKSDTKEQDVTEKPLPAMPQTPLQQLRKLVVRRTTVEGDKHVGHLVICIAPHGSSVPLPAEDSGFALLPANIGCSFTAKTFLLHEPDQHEPDGSVLYGLRDHLHDECYIIGGTFAFNGINSPTQYRLLRKVLRMAIYVHLALILEQSVLADIGIQLNLAGPKLPEPSPSSPRMRLTSDDAKDSNTSQPRPRLNRNSIIPSSFTNFFLKRQFSHRRSQTISQTPSRSGTSLDLTALPPSLSVEATPVKRRSIEGAVHGIRLRRLSFLGDRRASIWKSQAEPIQVATNSVRQPFNAAVKRIEHSRSLLSTSPGIILPVPKLIVELAEKESRNGSSRQRLKGDERVALTSILGWNGKDAEGRGMSGVVGFVRLQEISFLCSTHVPNIHVSTPGKSQSLLSLQQGSASEHALTSEHNATLHGNNEGKARESGFPFPLSPGSSQDKVGPLQHGFHHCRKPRWQTYQYFNFRDGEDTTLGSWIRETVAKKAAPCDRPGCAFFQGQHQRRLIHDGVRIAIDVGELDETPKASDSTKLRDEMVRPSTQPSPDPFEQIMMWHTCSVCGASSPRTRMSDGTYLFSFAKYLELLVYSPAMFTLTPPVCEHTTPAPIPYASLPSSRYNILWNFSIGSTQIVFSSSPTTDVFELKVPRLQITRGGDRPASPLGGTEKSGNDSQKQDDAQKKALRREIKRWWECISDHLDKIEIALGSGEPTYKSLPRLPSMDSAYDVYDASGSYSGQTTPHISSLSRPPPVPFPTPEPKTHSYFSIQTADSSKTEIPGEPPEVHDPIDTERLLVALRRNFQQVEQSLYAQLGKTPATSLNDVRRAFLATGVGSRNRLCAWQKKHLGQAKANMVGDLQAEEPVWWGKGFHVVPGCNIMVKENDWGSIIAHTLSTVDYQMELANLSIARGGSALASPSSPATEATATSSFFSVASGYKLFASPSKQQPDPDQEDVAAWNEPEPFSAIISRKENPRETLPLLSIRDVLRSKNSGDQQNAAGSANSSRFSSLTGGIPPGNSSPSSIKTKPDIALTIKAVDGENITDGENASKILQELENSAVASSRHTSRPPSVISEPVNEILQSSTQSKDRTSALATSAGNGDNIRRADAQNDRVVNSKSTEDVSSVKANTIPPPLPPKDTLKAPVSRHVVSTSATSSAPSAWSSNNPPPDSPSSHSSRLTSSIASGLQTAMRYVMKSEPSVPTSSASGSTIKKQHHTLLGDITHTDGRPHIKYDWTAGKRMKFSCTVYYAKQFDLLRKRCGIHEVFLKSMSKSTAWTAEGGKSKSNFWKTEDDRFIIKTLVNAWNVSDLQVLLDFAPAYFRYMDATTSRPTVLCKVLGFYTVEIRNLETGTVQAKSDLLVMENLFFEHTINKTFDLKGIQGRRVKSHGDTTKTFFDGEWIEGQQRTLTLVRPHSKVILRESIRSDTEFLAKSNIMDYSLLLGVDDQKKEIFCGLVDTIGSYTFAKTLEYKAKHGLQSTEVTVMPPNEYQERFVNALEGYFVACPDKWSKPPDESKIISDPNLLPSVL